MTPKTRKPQHERTATFSAEFEAFMRGVMEDLGDRIGVNLRGASDEVLREFLHRYYTLTKDIIADALGRGVTLEEFAKSEDIKDFMNKALLQAAQELFGGAEKAS